MMWVAVALYIWAAVAAFGIWAWRNVCLAQLAEARAERDKLMERTEAQFDRLQAMIARWARTAGAPPPRSPPLKSDNLIHPEFGKKPRTDDGGDAA